MNLKQIKKLELSQTKYDFMLACNDQHGADYKLYTHNGRFFNITKLNSKELLEMINFLGNTRAFKAKEYIFRLGSPFWSAWQHFGWTQGVCGYGVKDSICEEVIKGGLTLVVKYHDESYRITAEKLKLAIAEYKSYFQVNPSVRLVILPKFVFRKSAKRIKVVPVVSKPITKSIINLCLF